MIDQEKIGSFLTSYFTGFLKVEIRSSPAFRIQNRSASPGLCN